MENNKRKKQKYWAMQKKSKSFVLTAGMTGFLCTCNAKEKECIKDAYRLLELFDDNQLEENKEVDVATNNDEDISDTLSKEIKELNEQANKPANQKRFQRVDTGLRNVIFIRTTSLDPLELTEKIMEDLETNKQSRSRFLLRMIPVQSVCKANMTIIKSTASVIFEKYFAQEAKTFAIVFSRHHNNNIQKNEVIETLAALICEKNTDNKADLKNADIAVVVGIIKNCCLLSIAPNYFKRKKYNLLEIANEKATEEGALQKMTSNKGKDSEIEKKDVPEKCD